MLAPPTEDEEEVEACLSRSYGRTRGVLDD
jgi:hypothetical protein